MSRCFPDLFPDELFYSACARFSDKVNYPNHMTVNEELFGNKNVKGIVDLPCHLGAFLKSSPLGDTYTTDILINQHSLFPLLAPFLPKARAKAIYELMISDGGKFVHRKLGLTNSRLFIMPCLRYCPNCIKDDIETFGESYWHRSHQVRGFEICPKHLTFIESSSVEIRSARKRSGYFSVERSVPRFTPCIADTTKPINIILIDIAKDIVYLLDRPDMSFTSQQFIEQYRALLAKNDFLTKNGLVRHIELIEAFITYYTPELLERIHCTIYNIQAYNSWLARLVSTLRDTHPFLHHILTIRFLGVDVESFFSKKMEHPAPFGKGPWPCFNPVCPYYNKECIKTHQIIKKDEKNSKDLGIFSCACGFVYSRKGPDITPTDIYHKDRIISYGEVWKMKLKELWLNPSITRRQIARILLVSDETVTLQAAKLQLPRPRISPIMGGGRPPLVRDLTSYRVSWLNLLKETPEAGITELSIKARGLYTWLKNNDGEWFVEHCPLPKTPSHAKSKKNYSFLKDADLLEDNSLNEDFELANRVKIVVHQLLAVPGSPKRISFRAIGMHLPQILWLRGERQQKMPLTVKMLEEVLETREQFAIRRIWYIMQQYRQEGCFPSKGSFANRANIISLLHIPSINQAFEEAMLQLYSFEQGKDWT